MKKHELNAPVRKNEDIEITIDSVGSEGQGIGRIDGYCVFVERALPGERVNAHVIKVTAGYAVAKLTEVITPSDDRVRPDCPVYEKCGGCTLRHLSYPAQLEVKHKIVSDALTRIGGVDCEILPVIGMQEPDRYRNKGSFPFRACDTGAVCGLFAARSHRLIPIDDCMLQDERIMDVVTRISQWAAANKISGYDEESQSGVLRHVVVRVTTTDEIMVVLVTTGTLPKKNALLDALYGCDSIWHNVNAKNTNVIFGDKFEFLSGKATLTEDILGKRYAVSPRSFLQVNPVQTGVLYRTALELLKPIKTETLLDIYCGIGTISLSASDLVKHVTGIESVPDAIEDAKSNAELNGVTNADFICGNAEDVLPNMAVVSDAIVIDPPRKGCDPSVLQAILNSPAKRLVYVSCNPATLARDLKMLCAGGMHVEKVQPVDMFPGTSHVETVVLLNRN